MIFRADPCTSFPRESRSRSFSEASIGTTHKAHPDAGPAATVEGLKASGITVKPGLTGAIKYGTRATGKKRRRRSKNGRVAAGSAAKAVSVEQLVEVKKLADSLGGAEQVRAALETLEQLR